MIILVTTTNHPCLMSFGGQRLSLSRLATNSWSPFLHLPSTRDKSHAPPCRRVPYLFKLLNDDGTRCSSSIYHLKSEGAAWIWFSYSFSNSKMSKYRVFCDSKVRKCFRWQPFKCIFSSDHSQNPGLCFSSRTITTIVSFWVLLKGLYFHLGSWQGDSRTLTLPVPRICIMWHQDIVQLLFI